jgi:hypothetical protein
VEFGFLKKELGPSTDDKRPWIDPAHPRLSTKQQCELLGVLKLRLYGGGKMAVKLGVGRHLARLLTRILAVQSSGQTKSGAPILLIFRCVVAFCTWSP